MNLTHPARWFLVCGGTDAEGGGSDGVGGFAQAWCEYPGVARVTGHSRNTVRRYLRGGEAAGAREPATKRAEKLQGLHRRSHACGITGTDPGSGSIP
jgi:hypothetical protein